MFAKAILRMGVPVAARNIFPSNIQGLPTWFEVRVSEAGHMGRRGGVDLMVAMNPQTWDKDLAEIEPGGYLFYDCPPSRCRRRSFATISAWSACAADRHLQRPPIPTRASGSLFKNIIYVGALAALLDIDLSVMEQLVGEQFKGKDRLIAPNIAACTWAATTWPSISARWVLKVRHSDKVGDRIFARATTPPRSAQSMRRHGLRLVSDHPLDLTGRGPSPPLRRRSAPSRKQARRVTPSSRRRTRSPPSASWSRGLERCARLPPAPQGLASR